MNSEPGNHITYLVFLDYLAGKLSPEERTVFEHYLKEHPDEQEVLEGAKVLLEMGMTPEEIERDLESFRNSSPFAPDIQPLVEEPKVIAMRPKARVLRFAAACVLLVLVGLWAKHVWRFMNMYGAGEAMTVVHAAESPLEVAIRIDSVALSPPLAGRRFELPPSQTAFVISDNRGAVPMAVRFSDRSAADTSLVNWVWDFGDGTNTATPVLQSVSGEQYTVSLVVQDQHACMDSTSQAIPLNLDASPRSEADSHPLSPSKLFQKELALKLTPTSGADSNQLILHARPTGEVWTGKEKSESGAFIPGFTEDDSHPITYYGYGLIACSSPDSLLVSLEDDQYPAKIDTLYPIQTAVFALGPDDGFSQEALDRSWYRDSLLLDSIEQMKERRTKESPALSETSNPVSFADRDSASPSQTKSILLALHQFSTDTGKISEDLGSRLLRKLQEVDQQSLSASEALFTFFQPAPASTLLVHHQIPPDLFRPFVPIEQFFPKSQHILFQKIRSLNRFHLTGSIQHLEFRNQQESLSFLTPEKVEATLTVAYQLLDRTDDSILCENQIQVDQKGLRFTYLSTHGLIDSAEVDPQLREQMLDELMEDVANQLLVTLSACVSANGSLEAPNFVSTIFIPNAMHLSASSTQVPFSRFQPQGQGLQSYHIAVYSTWGDLVWESSALEKGRPSEYWDGTIGGQPAKGNVFVWKLHEITFEDGKEYEGPREGTLTVIR
ncbi:MAG: hypothetical protein AAF399_06320 [Bacteroidota bacterium]